MSRVLFTSIGAALLATMLSMPARRSNGRRSRPRRLTALITSTSSAMATINRCSWLPRTA